MAQMDDRKMTTMEILCCTDHNFVIPMGVMMHSLCINNKSNELHFHVFIDETVTEEQKKELREVINERNTLNFYLVDVSSIEKYLIVKVANFPISIYYRLLLADILPETVHKVLYLDADIIVRHDLKELYNTDIDEVAIAGVTEPDGIDGSCSRLDYPLSLGYFNSGVLLFNLDYFRKNNVTEALINFIKGNPEKLGCPDQDTLNFVLRNEKKMLPLKYNVQEGFFRVKPEALNSKEQFSAIHDPYIVHYTTNEKPWKKSCRHPLRNLYYEYRKGTPWVNSTFMEHFHHKRVISRRQQFNTYVMNALKKVLGKTPKIEYYNIQLNK